MAAPAFPQDVELDRLTAAEREILALLAQGHTAKSIALVTGRSIGSINERLRDARRKTGVGSSRELARLLQNVRDEQIGVALPSRKPQVESADASEGRPQSREGPIMASLLLAAAAVVALHALQPESAQPGSAIRSDDPIAAAAFSPATHRPEAVRRRFLAEPRDEAWATATEATLRSRYAMHVPGGQPLRVRCAATVCEVAGAPVAGRQATGAFMEQVQGSTFRADMTAIGLGDDTQSFGQAPGDPDRLAYVAYWQRRPTR